MFKFASLGAALAAVLSTQITSSSLLAKDAAKQSVQASTANLVLAETDMTDIKTAIWIDDSSNTPEASNGIGTGGTILALALVGGAVGVAVGAALNGKQPFKVGATLPNFGSVSSSSHNTSAIPLEQASRRLQKQLLRLLHEDRSTANRLLSQVKLRNPDKPIDWCVEKVIYDLERDRGRY